MPLCAGNEGIISYMSSGNVFLPEEVWQKKPPGA